MCRTSTSGAPKFSSNLFRVGHFEFELHSFAGTENLVSFTVIHSRTSYQSASFSASENCAVDCCRILCDLLLIYWLLLRQPHGQTFPDESVRWTIDISVAKKRWIFVIKRLIYEQETLVLSQGTGHWSGRRSKVGSPGGNECSAFMPKNIEEIDQHYRRCALRETFETTGLSPKDLRIEEGFKIELKYLSGTR